MAATLVLCESNGPKATMVETQDIDNVNLGSADIPNLITVEHPVVAVSNGHSFEKWIRVYCSDLGGSSQIDNLKMFLSDLGGGWMKDEGLSVSLVEAGYIAPSYPNGGPVDADSPFAVEVMPEAEPDCNLGIGGSLSGKITEAPAYSDYVVLQLDISEDTEQGNTNQKTLTIQYDEE
jgi:hypothetical protein